MKKNILLIIFLISANLLFSQKQVIISDAAITYAIKGSDAETNTNLTGSLKQFYIKGKMSRIDINAQGYKQSVITNDKTGITVILKEIGSEKYISTFNAEEWKLENKRFQGLTLDLTNETKNILGYECKKAIAKLKDGSSYSIYYATSVMPSTSENYYQFKDVPGLVLEYETYGNSNQSKISYSATTINFSPVPAMMFEIPKAGYRILKH